MSAPRPPLGVLIVEDSDEDHDTVLEALSGTELAVRTWRAEHGEECLKLLRGEDEARAVRPAVVLLDLNTHGLDGRATLRSIKDDPALKSLPTIVFTTSSNPHDLDLCFELGANAFHVKPFDYLEHLDLLRAVLDYWLRRVALPDGLTL